MLNLRDLPVFACDRSVLNLGSTWFPAYVACVEAFFVNARLAAEFLVRMPNRDFNARLFVPDWSPPSPAAERLEHIWQMTSKHIVHLGRSRCLRTSTVGGGRHVVRSADAYQPRRSQSAARTVHRRCRRPWVALCRSTPRHASGIPSLLRAGDRKAARRRTPSRQAWPRYVFQDPYAALVEALMPGRRRQAPEISCHPSIRTLAEVADRMAERVREHIAFTVVLPFEQGQDPGNTCSRWLLSAHHDARTGDGHSRSMLQTSSGRNCPLPRSLLSLRLW